VCACQRSNKIRRPQTGFEPNHGDRVQSSRQPVARGRQLIEVIEQRANFGASSGRAALAFAMLGVAAIGYAFLAGKRSLTEFDLGWQMAGHRALDHSASPNPHN
jgi:hypothetical protein